MHTQLNLIYRNGPVPKAAQPVTGPPSVSSALLPVRLVEISGLREDPPRYRAIAAAAAVQA